MNLNPEQPEPLSTMATTSPHRLSSFCKQTQAKASATGGHHRQDIGGPTVCWARHPLSLRTKITGVKVTLQTNIYIVILLLLCSY